MKIGDLMVNIWDRFLDCFSDTFAVCRFGDDLGFKSGMLLSAETVKTHILPQYCRIIDLVHSKGKPFLWHSCGCIFEIMDDVIALGIDAKHSNEDVIAPYTKWIDLYGGKIGLFGGIDVDVLCQKSPAEVEDIVYNCGKEYRQMANGYALGSGNSIPSYVPADGYLAMIEAAKRIRLTESECIRT